MQMSNKKSQDKESNQGISKELIQNVVNSINEVNDKRKKNKYKQSLMKKRKNNKNKKNKKDNDDPLNKSQNTIQQDNENQKNAALQYLQSWKNNPNQWKFKKNRQNWLFKFFFDKKQIEKKHLPILIEYASQSQGLARQRLIEQAKLIIKQAEENEAKEVAKKNAEENNETENDSSPKFSKSKFNRACRLLQSIDD